MGWTAEQQKAIDERNKNILVAAAAGSGKTAILIERIKKLVLEEKVPVDQMLIVTYTNAAAAEMKEKLRKSLNNELTSGKGDRKRLKEQLKILPRASISTFHAFALDSMRRFFYLTDLEADFSICEESTGEMLKEEALDQVIEDNFEEGSPEFYNFLDRHSTGKNLNQIRAIIENAYTVLSSLPYPYEWLKENEDFLSLNIEDMKASPKLDIMWELFEEQVSKCKDIILNLQDYLTNKGFDRLSGKLEQDIECYQNMESLIKARKFEELGAAISGFSSVRITANKEEKEAYAEIKDTVSSIKKEAKAELTKLKDDFFILPLDEQLEDVKGTYEDVVTLGKLLKEFHKIFKEKKAEKKLVDFNDIEHYSLEILSNEQAAKYYRDKFQYIFIDEYQDTNIIQEEIISKIKRDNNLFMVGDIKQSIYKFRLAEPEIFKRKYEAYQDENDNLSEKIDLNKNFRSKKPVIDKINHIFESLMDGYDDNAKLYEGVPYKGDKKYEPKIIALDTGEADVDEEIAELKETELEALLVCNIIKENLGKIIYDQKLEKERPLKASDIVILMRSPKISGNIFYKALKANGIESFIDVSESYFDTIEIDVFMKLLSVIDNRRQDIPLIAVLHSDIFGFSPDDLWEVRRDSTKGSYADAFFKYSKEGRNQDLRERCYKVLEKLKEWKHLSLTMPLGKFIWKLMLDSGYYIEMGAMPGGIQRQTNLRTLVDKAEAYSKERQSSPYDFIKYIEGLKNKEIKIGQVKLVGENADVVRIMTIHKSKGLEFPMVIVAETGKELNYSKNKTGVLIHKDIGIAMALVNYEERWKRHTLLEKIIKTQIRKEEFEEEKRVFYVALTRAKDILYITGTVKDKEKFKLDTDIKGSGKQTYLEMIRGTEKIKFESKEILTLPEEIDNSNFNGKDKENYSSKATPEEERKIRAKLDYVYPFMEERTRRSKYAATEICRLVKENKDETITLDLPEFMKKDGKITGAEKGTAYHTFMEHYDFTKEVKRESIEEALTNFAENGILSKDEAAAIDPNAILLFLESDIGKRCIKGAFAGKLRREKSFNLIMDFEDKPVIVQGTIDCYVEEEDGILLIDYKTDRLSLYDIKKESERLKDTYEEQMSIYKEALRKGLGKRVKEAYICHLENNIQIKI